MIYLLRVLLAAICSMLIQAAITRAHMKVKPHGNMNAIREKFLPFLAARDGK